MNETVNFQTLMPSPFEAISSISLGETLLIGFIGGLILTIAKIFLFKFGDVIGEGIASIDPKSLYMSATVVLLWMIYIKL